MPRDMNSKNSYPSRRGEGFSAQKRYGQAAPHPSHRSEGHHPGPAHFKPEHPHDKPYGRPPRENRVPAPAPMREELLPEDTQRETIEGRNPVLEALRAGTPMDKLYIARPTDGKPDPIAARIVSMAHAAGVPVVECDRRMLDRMSTTGAHQGVIAAVAAAEYRELTDIIIASRERAALQPDFAPLIVVCDNIADPGNLGAIIRSAEIFGADGIVIPRRRSVGLTASVYKASAGALSYLPVARSANVATSLRELKDAGFWIFGTDAEGQMSYAQADYSVPTALVIGSEGEGISRLTRDLCDYLVSIPMRGHINSLNASAAAAVMLAEVLRNRGAGRY